MNQRTSPASVGPVRQRYELVDALRGFALCGVLLANLSSLTLYQYMGEQAQAALPTAAFDQGAQTALKWLLHHKAVTVFALLFGFGFTMQLERTEAGGGSRAFVRRMGVLLAFGLLHSAFWWGDILLVYAIAGFALLPLRRCPDRWLPWIGFVLALPATALFGMWWRAQITAASQLPPEVFSQVFSAASAPSLASAFAGNFQLLQWWYPLGGLMLVCFSLGRFLLGAWAARQGLLREPQQHLPLLRTILGWTLVTGLATTALDAWAEPMKRVLGVAGDSTPWVVFAWSLLRLSGPLLLGIAIGTGFVLLYQRPRWQRVLREFAPAGRMALTHYLSQTVICSALFYGYGLGWGPWGGTPAWFVTWAVLFGAQMAASRWWLARFRFGPMEWLWRSITYAQPQAMRLSSNTEGRA